MPDLQQLHDEALRTIELARKAYDDCVAAYKVAKDSDTRHWISVAMGSAADTINAAQATLYSATKALKASDGVAASQNGSQADVTRNGEA